MAQPVNLNRYKKQKARDAKNGAADENAVKFGRTKDQKQQDHTRRDTARRDLDGHKIE